MQPAKVSPHFLRFRETHHAVARMFASGWTISKVCRETGISRKRLHLLLNDPSFRELIAEKAKTLEEKMEEGADRFYDEANNLMRRGIGFVRDSWDEYEEAGETPPFREVFAVVKDFADRFGYSAKTIVQHDHTFAMRLDKAIDASEKAKVIEHQPNPPSVTQPPSETPSRTLADARLIEQPQVRAASKTQVAPKAAPARSSGTGFQKTAPSLLRALRPV